MGPRGWVLDIAIAAALGGAAFANALTSSDYPQPGPATALLMGAAGGAQAFRRAGPAVAFVASMSLMSAAALLFGPYQAGSSLLIALVAAFSATAYGVGWWLFGAMTVVFAVVDNRGPMPDALFGAIFVAVFMGLAAGGGYLVRRLRELSAANAALRELVQAESEVRTRAAVDDERARIARELHDILSHSLGVVVLQTGAAEHAFDSDPERSRASLQAARVTSLEAIEQLRTLLSVVRDVPTTDRSPVPTVDDLVGLAERTSAAGFRVALDVIGVPRPLSPQVQASVFRVTQEGIANAMKHSGSHGCRIRLDYQDDEVVVEVEDDGGPATADAAGSRLGITGLRERASIFGGTVEAGPRPAGGWRLRAAFPS